MTALLVIVPLLVVTAIAVGAVLTPRVRLAMAAAAAPVAPSVVGIVMLLGTAVLYWPTLDYPWLAWDDAIHVTQNPGLNPVSVASVVGFWARPYEQLYIPVSYSFFAFETILGRLLVGGDPAAPPSPVVFHAFSLGLHCLASLLVWKLLGRLGVSQGFGRFAGAALFLCHPLQVESVAWISEQRGLISAVFSLVAVDLFLDDPKPSLTRPAWRSATAIACFILAVLAKPQAVSLPLVVLLLDARTGRESLSRTAIRFLPWACAVAAVLSVTIAAQPAVGIGDRAHLWLRPVVAGDALFHYARKLVVPTGLSIDYGRIPDVVLADAWTYVRAGVVMFGLVAVWLLPAARDWRQPIALSIAFLLPVLGIVPFAFQGISTVADRYAYLALLGPALLCARCTAGSAARDIVARAVFGVVLASCIVLTSRQIRSWSSSTALFTRAIEVNQQSYLAHRGLGGELLQQQRPAEALAKFNKAIALESLRRVPPRTYYPRARALHRLGNLDAASRDYKRALDHDGADAELRNDFGILLAQRGATAEAAAQFEAAIALRPGFTEAQKNLRAARAILATAGPHAAGPTAVPPNPKQE